jgi:hypothetical protein
MIASTFILNILDLLLNGDELGLAIRRQIPFLTDAEYDYTGVGLFVTFRHNDEIVKYETTKEERIILDGVTITSPELTMGASAILFIKQGLVDFLEIWSHDGEYPKTELSIYSLKQEGNWASGRSFDQRQ